MHFLMEQGRSLPQRRLQELVYEQWLHADLRDVVVQPCVPLCATQQQTCQITGQYIVQVFQYDYLIGDLLQFHINSSLYIIPTEC